MSKKIKDEISKESVVESGEESKLAVETPIKQEKSFPDIGMKEFIMINAVEIRNSGYYMTEAFVAWLTARNKHTRRQQLDKWTEDWKKFCEYSSK